MKPEGEKPRGGERGGMGGPSMAGTSDTEPTPKTPRRASTGSETGGQKPAEKTWGDHRKGFPRTNEKKGEEGGRGTREVPPERRGIGSTPTERRRPGACRRVSPKHGRQKQKIGTPKNGRQTETIGSGFHVLRDSNPQLIQKRGQKSQN
jgi:hypothetical protein